MNRISADILNKKAMREHKVKFRETERLENRTGMT